MTARIRRRRLAVVGTLLKQRRLRGAGALAAPSGASAPAGAARARCSRHARAHSPFYRERMAGAGPVVDLEHVPRSSKAEMMARYDEIVSDPRLRRDELLRWIETRRRDEHLPGRYRVMTTSGSSGRKGLFVYDRPAGARSAASSCAHRADGAQARASRGGGSRCCAARSLTHMSRRARRRWRRPLPRARAVGDAADRGAGRRAQRVPAPVPQRLPVAAMRLAEEQEAGRLRAVARRRCRRAASCASPAMTERLDAAFGVAPVRPLRHDRGAVRRPSASATTGIHLFEDASVVENVDEDGPPVPARHARRARARHQPPQPRPADHPARGRGRDDHAPRAVRLRARAGARLRALDGRCDDVLSLPARGGGTVAVLPAHFSRHHPRPRGARVPGRARRARRGAHPRRAVRRRRPASSRRVCAAPSRARWPRRAPTRGSRSSAAASWRGVPESCRRWSG